MTLLQKRVMTAKRTAYFAPQSEAFSRFLRVFGALQNCELV